MIKSIKFKNYKSFKTEQTLDLRPITVIIGKNNSGKSAVLRLVYMLQDSLNQKKLYPQSVSKGIFPLVYENVADSLKDLQTNGISLTLDGALNIEMSFYKGHNISCTFFQEPNDNEEMLSYEQNNKKWEFNKETKAYNIHDQAEELDAYHSFIVYHNPIRPAINRYYIKNKKNKDIGNYLLNNPTILSKLNNWYSDSNMDVTINFRQENDASLYPNSSFALQTSNGTNLADTGAGIGQSLPIVVETLENKDNTLHIVEQPELHLHPAAHANMAQLFADNKNDTVKFLVETHSQNFILRLCRLRVEGVLSQKDLALYYVEKDTNTQESKLVEITIDEDGGVNNWPEGIFSEGISETKAIREAQLKKRTTSNKMP